MVFRTVSQYKKWRRAMQVSLGLIFTNAWIKVWSTKEIYTGPLKSVCIPGMNCHACPQAILSCPIGILQQQAAIHQIPYMLMGYWMAIGLIFGRSACGWFCPFGWIQEMMYKIKSRKYKIPKWMRHLKWVFLVVFSIALPYFTNVHWFSKICPYGALIGAVPWSIWNPIHPVYQEPVIEAGSFGLWFWIKIAILVFFLVWFVLAKRPFCRVMCPMGLIFSWFNKISLLKLEVSHKCPSCESCPSLCPMDLDVNREADSGECIKCLDCTACKHVDFKFSMRYGFNKNGKASTAPVLENIGEKV